MKPLPERSRATFARGSRGSRATVRFILQPKLKLPTTERTEGRSQAHRDVIEATRLLFATFTQPHANAVGFTLPEQRPNFTNISTSPLILENSTVRRLFSTPGIALHQTLGVAETTFQPLLTELPKPTDVIFVSFSVRFVTAASDPTIDTSHFPPQWKGWTEEECSLGLCELLILSAAGRILEHVCDFEHQPYLHHNYRLKPHRFLHAARSALLRARGNRYLIVGHRLSALFAAVNLAFPANLCIDLDQIPSSHRYLRYLFSRYVPIVQRGPLVRKPNFSLRDRSPLDRSSAHSTRHRQASRSTSRRQPPPRDFATC